ncbi:uncharacterized protein CC84DRAFT_40943 [Paraphaeosphaeria sporulosa]|uniref:Uncharacterized protein n=1 Tax=Paraphaeosphaeria sporulosa TaxID=1460663 RepID=A0A177CXP9_9PLEO|nr:uncharacterized protein CC84DRAFT_40943 [Paraphaeosphaeria sporulosa]OAG11607.1 hypothetical protein CC84DRAFT_40943 [Paraphaeosphaeria sporulosa]
MYNCETGKPRIALVGDCTLTRRRARFLVAYTLSLMLSLCGLVRWVRAQPRQSQIGTPPAVQQSDLDRTSHSLFTPNTMHKSHVLRMRTATASHLTSASWPCIKFVFQLATPARDLDFRLETYRYEQIPQSSR